MNNFEQVIDYIFTNKPELISEIDLCRVAEDPRVTWTLISMYPQYLFNKFTSANPNITMDIVLDHKQYEWYMPFLSLNNSITWNDVISHPELEWDYEGLSQNDNIGWDIIQKNLDKPWNWISIYQKPTL